MRRFVALFLILGLVFGSIATAEAAKKKKKKKVVKVERVVELPYQCPCGPKVMGAQLGFWLAGGAFGGGPVATGGEDKFVQIEVTDTTGSAVAVQLSIDTDGDFQADTDVGEACGATEDPLSVPLPGSQISVFVFDGTCTDGTPSVAVSGVVKLTFSNLP